MENNKIKVSVIIPLYNEEKFIENCINSLINQTYPKENMEWIFVDGKSTDNTRNIIKSYIELNKYPIKILNNEYKKAPFALNIGIKEAIGEYIIRLDAHSYFYPDYIEKCVYYLDTKDCDNVGGVAETTAKGFIGKSIANMLSTKFGVGGSDFRVGDGNKYVDTVPFGAFKKEIFDKVGLFNTKLIRSEDNDMNSRIISSGGKIWLADDIRFKYYCRDSIKGILKMALLNGNALFPTLRENKNAMKLRHFIPFLFTLSLIIMPILSILIPPFSYLFLIEGIMYFILDFYFSFINKSPLYGFVNIWLYPLFHIVYGIGSFVGFFNIVIY